MTRPFNSILQKFQDLFYFFDSEIIEQIEKEIEDYNEKLNYYEKRRKHMSNTILDKFKNMKKILLSNMLIDSTKK